MITIQAWITPGIQPRHVRRMFKRKEPLQPLRRRTARGGRKMALRRILLARITSSSGK
jgi:hypothetical protein